MLALLFETTMLTNAGAVIPIRISSGQGYNHPSAPGFFEGRLKGNDDAGGGFSVLRSVFTGGEFGAGSLSYGSIDVVNPDGALDAWLDLGFGQPATVKLGDEDGPYSAFTTILSAKTTQATPSDTKISIGWASRMVELDQPATPATFAGTNSGTAGLEGLSTDIGGSSKPWALGIAPNISPILLNGSTRILGWNFDTDGSRLPTHSVDAAKFEGAPWTLYITAPGSTGGDYATAAALQTAIASFSVTQGYYVTCRAESLVCMGGSNSLGGKVTLDVTIEATAAERRAGNLWKKVLRRAGVADADISATTLAALNAAAPYQAGYYATGESFAEIADRLAASVAATYAPDRLGVFRIRQMVSPSGTPVAAFKRLELGITQGPDEGDLISLSPSSSGSDWTPVKQVRLAYARNWTPLQASEVAAAVSEADRGFLTAQWRYTSPITDAPTAAKYGNAVTRDFETCLAFKADAEAMAPVFLALFAGQRREYQATVTYGTAFAALLDLGAVVRVTHPKFGMAAGRLASIHAIRLRANTEQAELKLWL